MSLPSINFLHLTVSEIQPRQNFSLCPPANSDTMGENNTPTALMGCGVKTKYQILFGLPQMLVQWRVFYKPLFLAYKGHWLNGLQWPHFLHPTACQPPVVKHVGTEKNFTVYLNCQLTEKNLH